MIKKSGFTLPGETGYEKLTLELAKRWGADAIRDSDGTQLSEDILKSGYDIYSTICIIRDHNPWAKEHMEQLQQSFLITNPIVAVKESLSIILMKDYFSEQFVVNDSEESMNFWQVYDRTEEKEVSRDKWYYDKVNGCVILNNVKPWHKYTVSFLAYRIWEEISMYNHITNSWNKEHLLPIDPIYPEAQEYLLSWLDKWCIAHPETTIVRFTSLFYNFVWIWGSSENNRHLFTDWASYDFTVSPKALTLFYKKYGYKLTAEDFVNQGKYHVTHIPANQRKKDWMCFINDFVIDFGKKLIKIVHDYNKKAYVFYDDSWVGMEPYNGRFEEFGFDGIIKCVFNAYEARLCNGVPVKTHELRLHPYLFPTGVNGEPSFSKGGHPEEEAKKYWRAVRRALLRVKIDRLGLGGYLHLLEDSVAFVECMDKITDEFQIIKEMHLEDKPFVFSPKIAILHHWGKIRSWTLSGHFHETYMHDLIHINESLAGMPFDVSYIDFEDVKNGCLDKYDIVINAGLAGNAWSGGDSWKDEKIISEITKWVYEGGIFLGIKEPSAAEGYDTFFRLSHILGIDKDLGARVCHGKWIINGTNELKNNIYVTDPDIEVLNATDNEPFISSLPFGQGKGIYLSEYKHNPDNMRLLLNIILESVKEKNKHLYITDNIYTECAYYPNKNVVIIINNSDSRQKTFVNIGDRIISCEIEESGMYVEYLNKK